jgi:predicted  nucleic acid-binding Zn-ribbon protein
MERTGGQVFISDMEYQGLQDEIVSLTRNNDDLSQDLERVRRSEADCQVQRDELLQDLGELETTIGQLEDKQKAFDDEIKEAGFESLDELRGMITLELGMPVAPLLSTWSDIIEYIHSMCRGQEEERAA